MEKLTYGIYIVTITSVTNGISEFKKTPYLLIRFENSDGFFEQRIYQAGNYMKLLKILYNKAGIKSVNYDGHNLVGGKLSIELTTETRTMNNGNTISYLGLNKYYSSYEMQNVQLIKNRFPEEENREYTGIDDYAEIFGVDIEELARDMDIDVSEITEGLIMESAGY